MKRSMIYLSMTVTLVASGCAENRKKIWIDPPIGYEHSSASAKKLYYQVEDVQTGKRENLTIPMEQTPENLVIEGAKDTSDRSEQVATATKADQLLLSPGSKPKISYLRGLQDVETLFKKKEYSEALIHLAPLIEQYPNQPRLFAMQGTLYRMIDEKKLAYEAYKKAHQLDGSNVQYEEAMMRLQDEVGRIQ